MTNTQIARRISQTLPHTTDRYDLIWAIKQALLAADKEVLATDRETIDDILDILFDEYGYEG